MQLFPTTLLQVWTALTSINTLEERNIHQQHFTSRHPWHWIFIRIDRKKASKRSTLMTHTLLVFRSPIVYLIFKVFGTIHYSLYASFNLFCALSLACSVNQQGTCICISKEVEKKKGEMWNRVGFQARRAMRWIDNYFECFFAIELLNCYLNDGIAIRAMPSRAFQKSIKSFFFLFTLLRSSEQ